MYTYIIYVNSMIYKITPMCIYIYVYYSNFVYMYACIMVCKGMLYIIVYTCNVHTPNSRFPKNDGLIP